MAKPILLTIGIILGVILLSFGIKVLFFPVNTASKLIETGYDAQDKVLNADNAIYNYEWFKQQYEDINASKNQLSNAKQSYDVFIASLPVERTEWTFEDKNEQARLNTVVLGLQNRIETLIADYNARAKMATRNIFENSVLPSYIDALLFITK